jgi:GxxExxY protein
MDESSHHYVEPGSEINELARRVIGAAIEVHKALGPGYLESIYEAALCTELEYQEITFANQYPINVLYKGRYVGEGRLDLLVENCIVVELKAVDALLPVHTAQVISYLKATRCKLGLLINFNVPVLKRGIKRIAL